MQSLMDGVIGPIDISIEQLAKTGDREDFLVRVQHAQNDYRFGLSLTATVIAVWQINVDEAAKLLVDRLIYSHGTADAFPKEAYWFDSNNSASTVDETANDILNKGSKFFLHPSIKTVLSSQLFALLDELDRICTDTLGRPFVRSLDVLLSAARPVMTLKPKPRIMLISSTESVLHQRSSIDSMSRARTTAA